MFTGNKKYSAAADIGTTSIVITLADSNGNRVFDKSFYNPGRIYGADVISRISYIMKHPEAVEKIGTMMRASVSDCIAEGCASVGITEGDIGVLSVVGNPAMELLFAGISPEPLGAYPYTLPEKFGCEIRDMFTYPVFMGRLLSGYIGADSFIGAAYLLYKRNSKNPVICADLGTNCEIWCFNGNNVEFASTAAGPAFEGAHIECGMGALDGAVVSIGDDGDKVVFDTIGGASPRGFCGSGIIGAAAYLLDKGDILCDGQINPTAKGFEMSESGASIAFENGLYLTQKDIREIQTAKGAVAAGIELISGQHRNDACDIILTGAFGDSLDCRAAERIGLVPHGKSFESRANAALDGALLFCIDKDFADFVSSLEEKCRCTDLSMDDEFAGLFIKNINFPIK